ncbi:helix-turn-helix domain-containing protein [Paenibacillus flagellatus]|uniref:helix-turn-helix domain-containing protein n=1 Tax=Paenibacillus flagellatus TaxID=2211139 RepID=UPI0013051861|nr:AraC family transcriptional regulator [Paenibacillus flagellatus]
MKGRIRWNGRSLFAKLLLGFLVVIFISFAFNLLAYHFFYGQMRGQLIRSGTMGLSKTVDGYEKQLRQLDDLLTRYYFDNAVAALKKGSIDSDFPIVNDLAEEFKTIAGHYNLDLENVFIYFKNEGFVIDKNGFARTDDMFGKYYASREYGPAFWEKQFAEDFHLRAFPVAEFKRFRYDAAGPDGGRYFPVIVKSRIGSQFYAGALVDADRMFSGLAQTSGHAFTILGADGAPFYRTGAAGDALPKLPAGSSFVRHADSYYFYQTGPVSGLTYVSIVPYSSIAAQLSKLNALLLTLFAISVLVSVVISVLLSARFKHPVQRIVEALRQMNPAIRHRSSIAEFNVISESLEHMFRSIRRKDSLLQKYGYLDKIKSVPPIDTEAQPPAGADRPFHFVMMHIHYTREDGLAGGGDAARAANVLECVNAEWSRAFPDSVTMPIEKDRLLTIVFSDTDVSGTVAGMLDSFKAAFDRDKALYRLTIACEPRLWQPSEFTAAYESAAEMMRRRRLNDETQVIATPGAPGPIAVWTPDEERGFAAHLEAGSEAQLLALLRGAMQRLARCDAAAWQYRQFAGDLLSKLLMALMAHRIDTSLLAGARAPSPYDEIESFVSAEQYESFFERVARQAAALIREKREARDPIVDFVVRFIETHYGEDIYQDLIADRLNISTGYLRNYFKEKTGQNLSDYLNEYRIGKAKQMLEGTEDKIQDIAAKVGYQNANSFTRMFRRLTGVTPGEYRRECLVNSTE